MKHYKNNTNDILALSEDQTVPNGYTETTEEEFNRLSNIYTQIDELKFQLRKTDYYALKYAEGWYTDEDYALIKANRESLREQIRALERQI